MSMEELLKNLQREYVRSLPEKISDIRKHIKSGSVETLETAFHKLKGTGKTYGIPEISELAATVEHICHDAPAKACPVAAEALSILQDIHAARKDDNVFQLVNDPRFKKIKSHNN